MPVRKARMMAVKVRKATSDDIPELERLIPQSVRLLSAGYYTEQQIEIALAHMFGVDTALIEDGTYFIAELDSQIAGCGGWSRRKTLFGGDRFKGASEDSMLDPESEPGRIRAFYVHPNWARRGIGRAIIAECEIAAMKEGFKRLELVATLPGVPLYEALGYSRIEPFSIPLPDRESLPAILMGKDLTASPLNQN